MRLRTLSDFQEQLDRELSWRQKEITNLILFSKQNNGLAASTVVRVSLPAVYAHFEGFVKRSCEAYINFVAHQRLNCNEMSNPFVVLSAKSHISNLVESNKAVVVQEAARFMIDEVANRARISRSESVDTKSNLSSVVLENILLSVGIAFHPYETRNRFIDEELLARRNKIAHGEYLDIDINAFQTIATDVLALLRAVKTDLENAASLEAYRR